MSNDAVWAPLRTLVRLAGKVAGEQFSDVVNLVHRNDRLVALAGP